MNREEDDLQEWQEASAEGMGPGASHIASSTGRVFAPGGTLERTHPNYERREGQEEMALAIEEVLREGGSLLIEAGTGVGKTLAYLVPAALSGRRVIVSTGTKNLQDQIVEKDLPFVAERLGIAVRAVAVKGRDNYLCIRRFRDFDREPLLPTMQESGIYEAMRIWAHETETGDRGEAKELPDEVSFWRRVNARGDTCTGTKCEDYEACFLTKVRRRAEASQVIVVNHHLFFADLALRGDAFGKVLPDYDVAIFDEAHQIEETATLFFGVSSSSGRIYELADDGAKLFAGQTGRPRYRGGLNAEDAEAEGEGGGHRAREGRFDSEGTPRSRGVGFDDAAETRGSGAEVERSGRGTGRGTVARRSGRRLRAAASPMADELKEAASALFMPMAEIPGRRTLDAGAKGHDFEARVERVLSALAALGHAAEARALGSDEAASIDRRCRELSAQLEFVTKEDDSAYVYWMEARGRSVTLNASPVDVSGLLGETLFGSLHAAVLTSATLSVGRSFEFVRTRLGLEGAAERIVPSPFDYADQAVLYLPASMPEPRDARFGERMLREIEQLIAISKGRAFLLFTSYAELRRVEQALRGRTRHPLLVQGEKPRARLLEEFRETRGAVLLGAASFWHGVDVVGEALSLVVIDRIPFEVPSDPLVSARIGRIRTLGGEPFTEYQVPAAAIELKQGLGRLIRSSSDRGILAVLDARMRTKPYGRRLLESIPPFTVVSDIEEVRRFFTRP